MSDDAFYDSGAMSEREIQTFLDGLDCRPLDDVPCLADFREDTTTQPAVGGEHCAEYRGAPRERASRILAKVAVACGVSPRTLLVLLQKEQSLLTRPDASGYERATGYGCPDTADCDAQYFGFFNQVYHAAWQFRQYTEEPKRQYRIGTVRVQYHPDAACGATAVDVRNQATANLYNYTPYQPNPATIAAPETGDSLLGVREPQLLAALAPLVRRPRGRALSRVPAGVHATRRRAPVSAGRDAAGRAHGLRSVGRRPPSARGAPGMRPTRR